MITRLDKCGVQYPTVTGAFERLAHMHRIAGKTVDGFGLASARDPDAGQRLGQSTSQGMWNIAHVIALWTFCEYYSDSINTQWHSTQNDICLTVVLFYLSPDQCGRHTVEIAGVITVSTGLAQLGLCEPRASV